MALSKRRAPNSAAARPPAARALCGFRAGRRILPWAEHVDALDPDLAPRGSLSRFDRDRFRCDHPTGIPAQQGAHLPYAARARAYRAATVLVRHGVERA